MKLKKTTKLWIGLFVAGVFTFSVWQVVISQTSMSGVASGSSAGTSVGAPEFTAADLAGYNGKNGKSPYIAVDGLVYDLSNISSWKSGSHHGMKAGQDLTFEFSLSPHSKEILNQATVIGKLVTTKTASTPVTTTAATSTAQTSITQIPSAQAAAPIVSTTVATNSSDLTLEQLALYNGKNGQPAYIAVDGIVYDLSNISAWKNGNHHGVVAGQDLTKAFSTSPHAKSILDGAVIVGKFQGSATNTTQVTTGTSAQVDVNKSDSDDDSNDFDEDDDRDNDDRDEDEDSEENEDNDDHDD